MLKKFSLFVIFLSFLCLSGIIFAKEPVKNYFSFSPGTYWVYEDQDGNELTREVDKDKVVPSQTFHAFNYEPAVEEWFDYLPHLQPSRFSVNDVGVTFQNSDEIEKFIKARLTREFETLLLMEPPENEQVSYEIAADVSDQYLFLPLNISFNEEWDTSKRNASLTIKIKEPSQPIDNERITFNYTVFETGTILESGTVETPAGTFENCLKIEYRTETELNTPLEDFEANPPGETVTTLWIAPNVGIIKCHREMEDMFLKTAPMDEIPFTTSVKTLELKEFDVIPTKKDTNNKYYPVSPGSYWVYVDQDGNELTRRAIEDEIIPEKRLKAFKYKPNKDDWENYDVYTNSKLLEVANDGIVLHVGDEVPKAVKARLIKELDVIEGITNRIQESEKNDPTSQEQRGFETKYEVDVRSQELFQFLPDILTTNEEWEVSKVEANIDIQYLHKNTQNLPNNRPFSRNIWDITIVETGKFVGIETVETAAGKFNDCLKVKFRTETSMNTSDRWQDERIGSLGETTTTIWMAPHVGIVKSHKKSDNIILKALSKISENENGITDADITMFNASKEKTLELKDYEIKTDDVDKDIRD